MELPEIHNVTPERYKNLADKAYSNYSYIAGKYEEPDYDAHVEDPNLNCVRLLTSDEFFDRCSADTKFSEKWGVIVTERPMTFEEKLTWVMMYTDVELENLAITERACHESTPTKLIKLEYNGESASTFK